MCICKKQCRERTISPSAHKGSILQNCQTPLLPRCWHGCREDAQYLHHCWGPFCSPFGTPDKHPSTFSFYNFVIPRMSYHGVVWCMASDFSEQPHSLYIHASLCMCVSAGHLMLELTCLPWCGWTAVCWFIHLLKLSVLFLVFGYHREPLWARTCRFLYQWKSWFLWVAWQCSGWVVR